MPNAPPVQAPPVPVQLQEDGLGGGDEEHC
jgi:hypothetical protein